MNNNALQNGFEKYKGTILKTSCLLLFATVALDATELLAAKTEALKDLINTMAIRTLKKKNKLPIQ